MDQTIKPPTEDTYGNIERGACTEEHPLYCFDVLYCHLTSAAPIGAQFEDTKYPLFVTWNTLSSRPGGSSRLRGCIGNFSPMNLVEGLAEYTLISALEDHRFRPIKTSELHKLECVVSLLTDFEDVPTYLDWTVGIHGIYISFPHPRSRPRPPPPSSTPTPMSSESSLGLHSHRHNERILTATYLPDVIPEQDWTVVEAVDSAIRKAGWEGPIDEEIRRSIQMRRYQSRKATVTWGQYLQWRETHTTGGRVN